MRHWMRRCTRGEDQALCPSAPACSSMVQCPPSLEWKPKVGTSGIRQPRLISADDAIAVGEVGPICVAIWNGKVTAEPFEKQRSGLAEVVARNPDGAAFLCLVQSASEPPEDELRRASSQMIQVHSGRLKCVACVMEGEGFRAAINRGAFAGMVLLLRDRKLPVSVFAKVDAAADWMGRHIEIRSPQAFLTAVEDIRNHFTAPNRPGSAR